MPVPESVRAPVPELTDAQLAIVAHRRGVARVTGPYRSGRTTALEARAESLLTAGEPVLFICASGAERVRRQARLDRVVTTATLGTPVRVTTWLGLALEIVRRADGERALVSGEAQRRIVAQLLQQESSAPDRSVLWPTLSPLLARASFADAVVRALNGYGASFLGPEEIATHASAAGIEARWAELAAFHERYLVALANRDALDAPMALSRAIIIARTGESAAAWRRQHPHLLIDDFETASFAVNRLLNTLAGPAVTHELERSGVRASVVVAGNPDGQRSDTFPRADWLGDLPRRLGIVLDVSLANNRGRRARLVTAHHAALEGTAVAAEIGAALDRGRRPSDIAVIVPTTRNVVGLVRDCRRNGIAVAISDTVARALPENRVHPDAVALASALRWFRGDDGSLVEDWLDQAITSVETRHRRPVAASSTASVAHELWEQAVAPRLIGAGSSLDVDADGVRDIGALLGELDAAHSDDVDAVLESYRVGRSTLPIVTVVGFDPGANVGRDDDTLERVLITTPEEARGASWPVVLAPGLVEGSMPSVSPLAGFFDIAILDGPDVPSAAVRHADHLTGQRARFTLLSSRATDELVVFAAPEPGVLVSRFVADWTPETATLVIGGARAPAAPLSVTSRVSVASTQGPFDEAQRPLRLSASQLDTYANCPWSYALRYPLGVRGDDSGPARFGTMVHAMLEIFLRRDEARDERPKTLDTLLTIADEQWDNTAFEYRPQALEYRTRLDSMLRQWWESEGEELVTRPDTTVVATEHRFDIEIGPHRLTGSIDRVNTRPDGSLEVVDYKTGSRVATSADLDQTAQLAVYYLAALRDPAIASVGVPRRLRLAYLQTGRDVDLPVTSDLEARAEAHVLSIAGAINQGRFEPSLLADCDHCELKRLCPLQEEGREVVTVAARPAQTGPRR